MLLRSHEGTFELTLQLSSGSPALGHRLRHTLWIPLILRYWCHWCSENRQMGNLHSVHMSRARDLSPLGSCFSWSSLLRRRYTHIEQRDSDDEERKRIQTSYDGAEDVSFVAVSVWMEMVGTLKRKVAEWANLLGRHSSFIYNNLAWESTLQSRW